MDNSTNKAPPWGVIILTALVLLTVAAVAPAGAEPSEETVTNQDIVRNFDTIAFGNEYTGRRYDNVRKWRQPIRVGIEGRYPKYFETFVLQHIRDLRKLTGHSIRLYYSPAMQKEGRLAPDFDRKKINLILYYLPVDKIPKRLARYFDNDEAKVKKMIEVSTCFAKFGTKINEIRWAIAVFPSHHSQEYMRACVVEEMTQVLGLPNDSNAVKPSIFNDSSQYFELTAHDRWLIKMLYDPRITVGMPRPDAIRAAATFLDEHRKR
ncbi:MAG: DUF2927 domain-containing protein [Proteobacteria bacterium]|nr:DUF2927 domain-containing protein [Pseudomonadota bacterium]